MNQDELANQEHMVSEIADYSDFLKVDLTKGLSGANDVVEDMLTRLEEFQGLIQMVQTDSLPSVDKMTEDILGRKDELKQMCERIDGLESLVSRVKKDMDTIESLLHSMEAESGTSEGAFLKTLGSLFSKPVLDTSGGSRSAHSPFNSPDIFSCDKVFSSSSTDEASLSSEVAPRSDSN